MERRDNYAIQAQQAKQLFLSYNAEKLAKKLNAKLDENYFYTKLFLEDYRIQRSTGDITRLVNGEWMNANSFNEVLTIFDLVCDSREDRFLTMRWKNMQDFGLQFHQNLAEGRNPWAERFETNLDAFHKACREMGAEPFKAGDASYSFEVFDGLRVIMVLWLGDEDFPAQLRYLWDENAKMYIRYETMYYALNLLLHRLAEKMPDAEPTAAIT